MTGQPVGTVTNYDPEHHVAAVRLEDILRLGDQVAIQGKNGGLHMAVQHMVCKDCELRFAEAGQEIILDVPQPVEKGSKVEMQLEAPWGV